LEIFVESVIIKLIILFLYLISMSLFPTVRSVRRALKSYVEAHVSMFRLASDKKPLRDVANDFYEQHGEEWYPLSDLDIYDELCDALSSN